MFALTTFSGDPMTKAWADARQRWEPLFEAIQMKGTERVASVAVADRRLRRLRAVGPRQPDADAEEARHDRRRVRARSAQERPEGGTGARAPTRSSSGWRREPTPTTASVAAEEDNFFAKFPSASPRPDRWDEDAMNFGPNRIVKGWEMTAAGYTASGRPATRVRSCGTR
jgi:hypothetical protein